MIAVVIASKKPIPEGPKRTESDQNQILRLISSICDPSPKSVSKLPQKRRFGSFLGYRAIG